MTTFQTGSDLDIPGLGLVGTSRSDSQKLEANPIRQSSSFTQALGAAFRNELTGLTYDFLSGPGRRYDPSFVLTKDVLTQAREGVADEFVPMFADAGSIDDVQAIREVALERTRRMAVLANAGTTSRVAASILASVVDPINLTAGVLTGSAGLGVGLTRAARITRAASAGFITNTALESYRSTLDPTVTGENIVVSGLSGAGLGAGIGGTLTRSAGVRALAGGVGAAAPVAAFQSDGDALESAIGIGTAFLAGGVAGTLTPRAREEASRVIRTQVKTMVREELGNAGTLTPEGERYFADTTPAAFETRQQAAVESVSNGVMDEAKRFDEIASIARANTEVPLPEAAAPAAASAIKVYRGDMAPLEGGKHLSGVQSIDNIIRPGQDTPPTAPFKFYTTDPEDAARYASTDARTVARYDKRNPGKGAELFETLHGHKPRADGTVAEFEIAPKKTLDLTKSGPKQTFVEFTEAINDAMGLPPLPENWRYKDLPQKLKDAIDGPLQGPMSVSGGDANPPMPVWRVLRNEATTHDVWRSKNDNGPGFRSEPIPPERLSGSAMADWMESQGFDSVAYMHDTPNGPVKHIVMLDKTAAPTTAVGAATQADTTRTAASPFGDTYDQTIPLPRNGFFTPQQATDGRSTGAHFGTMEAMAGRSSVPSIRRIANMVFDDPVPRSDGNVFEGADKWTTARTGEYANPFLRVANQAFSETGNTLGIDDAQLSRMWYRSVVSDANNIPASMLSLQEATRTAMKDVLEFEKAHQVPGAADVPANEFYLPHKGRRDLIDSLVLQYGEQPIIDHVAKAFKARRPQAPDRVANAVATAWVRKIGTHTRNDLVRPDAFDTVIRLLEESNTDPALIAEARIVLEDHVNRSTDRGLLAQLRQTADPAERESIRSQVKGADDAGNPSNYKHRLDLDELVESVMPDGRSISLLDMLETDPRVLIPHRIRRAAGNSAFAQILKWSQNPISPARPVTSLADLLESLRKDARDAGLPEGAEEGNIRRLEVGLKHVIGIPIDDIGNPTTQRAARMARIAGELTGAKFLSGAATGLANVTETIGAVAAVQLRTTFEMVPALKELRSMALDGKLTNADLALAESFTGAGLDSLTYVAPHRPSGPALNTFDRVLTWIEPKSAKINELAMRASLMTLGNEVSQKIIAGGLVHQWGKWIQSGKAPGKKWLKGTNLDGKPYLVDRIIAQGQKYGTLGEPGTIAGKKGFDLNWHEWDDVEAAAALRSAVNLEYGRLFLQPSKINAYAWSTTWWGKLALQLKRYPMAAFRSKLVYGFATGDVRHWATLGLGTAATVPIYIMRTYAESLGQDDPQKYREERLSMGAMARATVGRAAWASMLPSAVDGLAATTGFEPPFAISSTTGRKAELFNPANIPALGIVNDVARAVPDIVQPPINSEYSFSMQGLKNLERALMPNAIRQLHIIDAAGRMLGLPETPKE